ncbi:MAG: PEP-utilizing enzyme [Firmicutes bacterium]|nr:PEP-utilizing enzyme [Bacillota bacterium]
MSKARNLRIAADNGLCVPPFVVVAITGALNIVPIIDTVLEGCTVQNAKETADKIERIIRAVDFPAISLNIGSDKKYAVRSSGADEDSDEFSFAGQYQSFLNVSGASEIEERVIDCYISQYSEQNILYRLNNGLPLVGLTMNVIVQEMIVPEVSGVAFSVNVLTGNDTQIMYDVAAGLGENVVGGESEVSSYTYDWYNDKDIQASENGISVSRNQKDEIVKTVLKLQCLYGYPVDVEFAFAGDALYVLQVRPITKIVFGELQEQFTNANFRDGGVAARPCNALLWSLYEFSYHNTLKDFFIATKAFKEKNVTKQIRLFFGKPYFNVTACKTACAKLPGFIERDYDADLGICPNYEGKGKTTKITPGFLLNLPFVLGATFKTLRNNEKALEQSKETLLAEYRRFAGMDLAAPGIEPLQAAYKELILSYYAKNEGNYFWQVFVNIVRLSLYRRQVQKAVTTEEYFNLLSNIKDISHVRIFERANEFAKFIKADNEANRFWQNSSLEEIVKQYKKDSQVFRLNLVDKLNEEFGYHSDRELDLTCPDYYEDPNFAVGLIKAALDSPDKSVADTYGNQCELFRQKFKSGKYKKIVRHTETMRKFLWWREEFKDLSTRCYSLIRRFTLALANDYVRQGIIDNPSDIFHLKFTDIFNYIDGNISPAQLKKIIEKSKIYYNSFVNYKHPNEISGIASVGTATRRKSKLSADIFGVGCGGGIAKRTAKVISTPEELATVQSGDIVIAKHFDASFAGKFNVIAGIITETGGVLCHSSIIAREYNLPAIVSADGATTKIKTGNMVEMNADTGTIRIL